MACRVLFLVHTDVKMERYAIVLKIYYSGSHIIKSILIMNQLMTLVLSINTLYKNVTHKSALLFCIASPSLSLSLSVYLDFHGYISSIL